MKDRIFVVALAVAALMLFGPHPLFAQDVEPAANDVAEQAPEPETPVFESVAEEPAAAEVAEAVQPSDYINRIQEVQSALTAVLSTHASSLGQTTAALAAEEQARRVYAEMTTAVAVAIAAEDSAVVDILTNIDAAMDWLVRLRAVYDPPLDE